MNPGATSFIKGFREGIKSDYAPIVAAVRAFWPTDQALKDFEERVVEKLKSAPDFYVYDQRSPSRDAFICAWGWTKCGDGAAKEIARHGPIIEIFAGSGLFAWYLSHEHGIDVVAIDSKAQETYSPAWPLMPFNGIVRKGSVDDVSGEENSRRSLLMMWPPRSEATAEALGRYGGKTLLYVGEPRFGSNGDDEFFEMLDREWNLDAKLPVQRFEGKYDALYVFHRRSEGETPAVMTDEVSDADALRDVARCPQQ